MKHIVLAAGLASLLFTITPASAQQRCPAGDTGCTIDNAHERIRDRVQEGANTVLRDTNANGRVREVYDTLKDCITCGMDAIRGATDSPDEE